MRQTVLIVVLVAITAIVALAAYRIGYEAGTWQR